MITLHLTYIVGGVMFFKAGFPCVAWLSWNALVDQADLKLTEIHLSLPPECSSLSFEDKVSLLNSELTSCLDWLAQ